MNSIEIITAFFGWCTVINFGILIVAAILLVLTRDSISKIHGKMFGLNEMDVARAYFQYLAQYKIAIFVLNLVPYIALRMLS